MKKAASIAAIILVFVLIFGALPGTAYAAGFANSEKAVDLKILGLLDAADNKFDLGTTPTCADGAVMLVRLIGKDSQALKAGYTHPFKDVPVWADDYIGYMYKNNLALGTQSKDFKWSDPLSALQYTAFVLAALGYDGFKYEEAIDKAVQIGLLTSASASSLKSKSGFLRDDMIGISYNALNVKLNASDKTLLDKLVSEKVVYNPAATMLGLYTSDLENELGNIDTYSPASTSFGYAAKNSNDLFLIVRKFLYLNQTEFKVDASGYDGAAIDDLDSVFKRAYEAVKRITGVDNFFDSWECHREGIILNIKLIYKYKKDDFDVKRDKVAKTIYKARQIVSGLIKKDMSDYDKEKLLHDYIVNNTRYDSINYNAGTVSEDSYTAYGSLIKGTAVCQGYSEVTELLLKMAGLECRIVSGESFRNSKWSEHVWNIAMIEGAWYHLDSTFDDPVIKNVDNMLIHQYFNLTDDEAAKINRWKRTDYPVCNSIKNSYYYKSKLIAGNHKEFVNAVNSTVKQRKTEIELRVEDYTEDKYSNLSAILFATNTVSRYQSLVNKEFGIVHIYNIQYF